MIKSLLVLVSFEAAFAYQELCIPQGNKCRADWQCCKGFHCADPIYKEEPHCIADHKQLTHSSDDTDSSGDMPFTSSLATDEVLYHPATEEETYPKAPSPPPAVTYKHSAMSTKKSPEQIMMMKLMEAALGQLTQGKPIRMKVNIKNPQVLLGKLPDGPSPDGYDPSSPGYEEPASLPEKPGYGPPSAEYEGLKKFNSPWGEHTYKEDEEARIVSGEKLKDVPYGSSKKTDVPILPTCLDPRCPFLDMPQVKECLGRGRVMPSHSFIHPKVNCYPDHQLPGCSDKSWKAWTDKYADLEDGEWGWPSHCSDFTDVTDD